jgi:hypothetical protein
LDGDFDGAVRDFGAGVALFLCCFCACFAMGADFLMATLLLTVVPFAAERDLTGAAFFETALRGVALLTVACLDLLVAFGAGTVACDFVALRTGAFSAAERLVIGLGRADLVDNARLLAEDVVAL